MTSTSIHNECHSYPGSALQSLEDWETLLKLVASRDIHHSQSCDQHKDSDWLPDMTWENVVNLALKQLGPSRLVPLLKDVPYTGKALPREFYYKCIMGAVIEKEQTWVPYLSYLLIFWNCCPCYFAKDSHSWHQSICCVQCVSFEILLGCLKNDFQFFTAKFNVFRPAVSKLCFGLIWTVDQFHSLRCLTNRT